MLRTALPTPTVPRVRGSVRRVADTATILAFFAVLAVPLAGFLRTPAGRPTTENRALASPPALVAEKWAVTTFPVTFEAYFNDRVGFRPELLDARRRVLGDALGDSTSWMVWPGTDGWLFINAVGPFGGFPAHQPDPDDRIAGWAAALADRHTYLKSRGIEYVVAVVRDKDRVYPEHLDPAHARHPAPDLLPTLRAHLAGTGLTVLDPLPELLAAKADGQVFYKFDSHWTDAGAVAGWQPVAAELRRRFPSFRPLPPADYGRRDQPHPVGDLSKTLGRPPERGAEPAVALYRPPATPRPTDDLERAVVASGTDWFRHLTLTASENPTATGPPALLLHDSFGCDWARLTAADFARFASVGTVGLPVAVIEAEKPRVVIQTFVDRRLRFDPPPPKRDN